MWAEMADKADGRVDVVEQMREREAAERVAERKTLEQKTIDDALATIKDAEAN